MPGKYDTLDRVDDVLILGQRDRRWTNIKTALFQRVVAAGPWLAFPC